MQDWADTLRHERWWTPCQACFGVAAPGMLRFSVMSTRAIFALIIAMLLNRGHRAQPEVQTVILSILIGMTTRACETIGHAQHVGVGYGACNFSLEADGRTRGWADILAIAIGTQRLRALWDQASEFLFKHIGCFFGFNMF